jgi:hypothetical protein
MRETARCLAAKTVLFSSSHSLIFLSSSALTTHQHPARDDSTQPRSLNDDTSIPFDGILNRFFADNFEEESFEFARFADPSSIL